MHFIESLEELKLKKGEIHSASMDIGSFPDTTRITIPIIVGEGTESGPTLLLTALLHGIEIGGYDVIRKIMYEEIDFNKLAGRIIAVPIVNPTAFYAASRYTPQDSADLNRSFPGNMKGTLSQRIAGTIIERIVPHADYVIDYHSCNPPSKVFTIVDAAGNYDIKEESLNMAKAFGALTVVPSTPIPGTFSSCLAELDKPAITPELVFSRRFDTSAESGLIGTKNVMKHLKMIEGEIQSLPDTIPYKNKLLYTSLNADAGGFIYFDKSVGETIRKNEKSASLLNPWGECIEDLCSPVDGMIIAYPLAGNQSVTTGDKIAYFASEF